MVRVLKREAENVSVMGDLDFGTESKSDIAISVLAHFLQNTALSSNQEALFFFFLSIPCLLLLLEEETNCDDNCDEYYDLENHI